MFVYRRDKHVAQFGGDTVFNPQASDLEAFWQQFHRHTHIVGVVHVTVVVDVGTQHTYRLKHFATLFGQDDTAVFLVHLKP